MAIYWGNIVKPDYFGRAAEAIDALESAHAEMRVCNHYTHWSEARIQVMCAGGYSGDPLDDSNAATLEDMARAWIDDDRESPQNDVENVSIDWHPLNGNGSSATSVCVNPALVNPELLGEIIASAEAFAEYPVLDDSDYSEREWAEYDRQFTSELDLQSRDVELTAEQRSAIYELASQHFGESDPGYVNPDWITEAATKLNINLESE